MRVLSGAMSACLHLKISFVRGTLAAKEHVKIPGSTRTPSVRLVGEHTSRFSTGSKFFKVSVSVLF